MITNLNEGLWNGYEVNNIKPVIEAIRKNNGTIFNDHNGGSVEPLDGYIVVERFDDQEHKHYHYIAATSKAAYFSVNPLYVGEDGMAHISTRSIGGVVTPCYNGWDMEKAIAAYNEEHQNLAIKSLEEKVVDYVDLVPEKKITYFGR